MERDSGATMWDAQSDVGAGAASGMTHSVVSAEVGGYFAAVPGANSLAPVNFFRWLNCPTPHADLRVVHMCMYVCIHISPGHSVSAHAVGTGGPSPRFWYATPPPPPLPSGPT